MNPLAHLRQYQIILGSASPRRKELLSKLALNFTIEISHEEEVIDGLVDNEKVPAQLALQKAGHIIKNLKNNYLLITADTIVLMDNQILGKPKSREGARKMLRALSGKTHSVITGVAITSQDKTVTLSDRTEVSIAHLSDEEIAWYINNYEVMDKAGSYGVQDWLGVSKVNELHGSYYNVMGLPVDKIYTVLKGWTVDLD